MSVSYSSPLCGTARREKFNNSNTFLKEGDSGTGHR